MQPLNEKAYRQRWIALAFICLSLLALSFNDTTTNVALPSIAKDMQASSTDLMWVVNAYILIFAALLLPMGSAGDRYGRKLFLLIGLALLCITSTLASFSGSIGVLIAMRGIMGIGGAMIMPSTLSIISATFTDKKERTQAIAIWAATFGLGSLGTVLGGWLLEHFPSNSVFLINVPLAIIAIIGGYFFVSNSRDEHAPSIDLPGIVLSIIGLVALTFGIISIGEVGWSDPSVIKSLGLAIVFLAAFCYWESKTENPMLPLYLFKNRSFSISNLALVMDVFTLGGIAFFYPQYFQTVLGYSALNSGLARLPLTAVYVLCSTSSAKLVGRWGVKKIMAYGLMLSAIGLLFAVVTFGVDTSYPVILITMIFLGIGSGILTGPATDSAMSTVPISKVGVGSATNSATISLGGAIGLAVLGAIMNGKYISELHKYADLNLLPLDIYNTIRSGVVGAHHFGAYITPPQVQSQFIIYVDQAFVTGMKSAMLVDAALMLLTAIAVYRLLPDTSRRGEEDGKDSIRR
jgi:EmrB/QacA subfamily drug resistance transporter